MNRRYGRIRVVDTRDHLHLHAPAASARVRRLWADTRWTGDQGDTPQCVGYATAHWLACWPAPVRWLDPAGLYDLAQHYDDWEGEGYEGTSVRGAVKVLHRLGIVAQYRWCRTPEAVVSALLDVGPLIFGIDWTEGMADPVDGVIHPTGPILGGHAVLASGVDTRLGQVRLKNSWGRDWGQDGHAWIPIDELLPLLRRGEACLPIKAEVWPR